MVASTKDGSLAWTHPVGNLQLVLRSDAVFAAGQQGTTGARLDYDTGKVLDQFPARRACTRATGCADSIFFRATGGTVRVMTDTNSAHHIAPMRPPCQDGVIVSNGHLYWGPWMCGCQLSLYGNIGVCPAPPAARSETAKRLQTFKAFDQVAPLGADVTDWASFRGDSRRSDGTQIAIPDKVRLLWSADVSSGELPTAPVAAGGLVLRDAAHCADARRGRPTWHARASQGVTSWSL